MTTVRELRLTDLSYFWPLHAAFSRLFATGTQVPMALLKLLVRTRPVLIAVHSRGQTDFGAINLFEKLAPLGILFLDRTAQGYGSVGNGYCMRFELAT